MKVSAVALLAAPLASDGFMSARPAVVAQLKGLTSAARVPARHVASMRAGENGVPGAVPTVWDQHKIQSKFPPLSEDVTAEVVIAGAGIAGLTLAYKLAKAGKSVVVLEKTVRGGGQTGRSTAQLQRWNDKWYHQLEPKHGLDAVRQVAEAQQASIDLVADIIQKEDIDCDFKWLDGYLFPNMDDKGPKEMLQNELDICQKIGWDDVKMVDLGGGQEVGGITQALHFPRSGRFHPLKYLEGLADAAVKAGAKIYENTGVSKPAEGETLETFTGHKATATEAVVVATQSPINHNLAVHARQEAMRLYVVCFKMPKDSIKDACYWDTDSPYHSFRLQEYGDDVHLIVRGANHPTGQRPSEYIDSYADVEHTARKRFPQAGEVTFKWSGQIYNPTDQLHLFGRDPVFDKPLAKIPHYIATGEAGQGMTGGTISAMVLSDYLLKDNKEDVRWGKLFNPERFGPLLRSLEEQSGVIKNTAQGYADTILPTKPVQDLKGALTPGKIVEDLEPGTGIVVQQGIAGPNKVAIFKADNGEVRKFSAICPHLKCAVEYNPVAKTFDCPCHGSQFDDEGQCIQGPALVGLPPVE